MNITDFRKQYPQYDDMSDSQLADALHGRFYSDMPKDAFYSAIGVKKAGLGEDVAKSAVSGAATGGAMLLDAVNPLNMAKDFVTRTKDIANIAMGGKPKPLQFSTPATNMAVRSGYDPQTASGRYTKAGATGAVTGLVGGLSGAVSGAGGSLGSEGLGDAAAFTFGEGARPFGQLVGGFAGAGIADAGRRAAQRPAMVDAARKSTEAAKNAAYQVVDQSNERIALKSVNKFVRDAKESLKRQGYVESAPEYASITRKLDELASKPSAELTPAGFDAYMKGLDNIAGGTSEAKGLAGSLKRMTINFLDEVDSPYIREARAANRKNEAFKLADDVQRRIEQRAPSTTRQTAAIDQFRGIANDADQMGYLMPAQRSQVERAATTTGLQRALREGGKLAPNRLLGFGAAGGAVGAGVAGGTGMAAPFLALNAAGLGSEALYRMSVNRQTRAALDALRSMPAQQKYSGLGALTTLSQDEIERMMREAKK